MTECVFRCKGVIMNHIGKPVPAPDPDTQPFWDACKRHELMVQRCAQCGHTRFPPAAQCPHCGGRDAAWIKCSGHGRVFSWIVVVHPVPKDVYGPDVPYAVALIDLEEGVRIASNIVGCDPQAIAADMAVEVRFDDVSAELTLPRFTPRKV